MINISIQYDLVISKENADEIPKETSGVYLLFDESDEILYVGIAQDLKYRIRNHLMKQGNTKWFAGTFEKIRLLYEEDPLLRRVAEMYLINSLHPPLNKQGVHPESISAERLKNERIFTQCNGETAAGERCMKTGHSNGYCHYHGGNGISISGLRNSYDQQYIKKQFLQE